MDKRLVFQGVTINWEHPESKRFGKEAILLADGAIHRAIVRIFRNSVDVAFMSLKTGYVVESGEFSDFNEFTEYWDILDRRILLEKTGCL